MDKSTEKKSVAMLTQTNISEIPTQLLRRSISNIERLHIANTTSSELYGAKLAWFTTEHLQKRGSSLLVASLCTSYLARHRGLVSLFRPYKHAERSLGNIDSNYKFSSFDLKEHMKDLSSYMKIGVWGLLSPNTWATNVRDFISDRGLMIETRIFRHRPITRRGKNKWEEAQNFLYHQLMYDIPIAWISYDKAKTNTVPPSFTWIAIVAVKPSSNGDDCIITVIEDGKKLKYSLKTWIETTNLGGAFVALRPHQPKD